MAKNIIDDFISKTENNSGSFVIVKVTETQISLTSDSGVRKSTKNINITFDEMINYEKQIKGYDERCVLFCKLDRVKFVLHDGRISCFEKKYISENLVSISSRKISESKTKNNNWIICDSIDGAVAFKLSEKKNNKYSVIPTQGGFFKSINKVEDTDLFFCVSGHIKGISAALMYFIKNALRFSINMDSLFEVLPSTMDEGNELITPLINVVKEVYRSDYPLFKNNIGTIVPKKKVFIGTKDVVDLFPQKIMTKFFDEEKYWILSVKEGGRSEYFLIDIGIPKFDREGFLDLIFDDFCLDELSEVLERQNDKWLRRFYIFCAESILQDKVRKKVYSGLKNIKCIRNAKSKMCYPHETLILSDDIDKSSFANVVKNVLIYPKGQQDEFSADIMHFFIDYLNVNTFSYKNEIENVAKKLEKRKIDRSYLEKLIDLAEYDKNYPNSIDFTEYCIFPYKSKNGIRHAKAVDIVIGKPFFVEGNLISNAVGKPSLWSDIKKLIEQDKVAMLIAFAEKYGAIGHFNIIKVSANDHPYFKDKLYCDGKQGKKDTNFDFTIRGLDAVIKKKSLRLCRLIWNSISSVDMYRAEECLYAEYSSDNRAVVNRIESSLINLLRSYAWVPDKNNKLHKPEDIKICDISDDLSYNRKNPILKALNFGSEVKKNSELNKKIDKIATKLGLKIVDINEYKEFIEWKKSNKIQ